MARLAILNFELDGRDDPQRSAMGRSATESSNFGKCEAVARGGRSRVMVSRCTHSEH